MVQKRKNAVVCVRPEKERIQNRKSERLHERLSENYLSVNFSTLYLTVLKAGAITIVCSGGRVKERAARLPGRPFRVNNIKIFDPTRTPGLEE